MRYFNTLPVIDYNNVLVRNIVARVRAFERAKKINTIFYTYRIKDGERADTVAYNYYGNANYFWVIYLVNDIVDPYYDWPMSNQTFDRYIIEKYGSIAAAQALITKYRKIDTAYYLHNTLPSVIIPATDYASLSAAEKNNYTRQDQSDDVFISTDTYDLMTADLDDYEPVYAYTEEIEANESRREIKLLNLDYLSKIEEDLKRLMR
jgi:hypothetical protein